MLEGDLAAIVVIAVVHNVTDIHFKTQARYKLMMAIVQTRRDSSLPLPCTQGQAQSTAESAACKISKSRPR